MCVYMCICIYTLNICIYMYIVCLYIICMCILCVYRYINSRLFVFVKSKAVPLHLASWPLVCIVDEVFWDKPLHTLLQGVL